MERGMKRERTEDKGGEGGERRGREGRAGELDGGGGERGCAFEREIIGGTEGRREESGGD